MFSTSSLEPSICILYSSRALYISSAFCNRTCNPYKSIFDNIICPSEGNTIYPLGSNPIYSLDKIFITSLEDNLYLYSSEKNFIS